MTRPSSTAIFRGKEIEVDVISDGEGVLAPGIMEDVERAGFTPGIPSPSIRPVRSQRNRNSDW